MLGYNSGENHTGVLTLNSESALMECSYNATMSLLTAHGYTVVKKARRKGYIKRGKGLCLVADYNGRYGTGVSVFLSSNDSSRYIYVLYFIN